MTRLEKLEAVATAARCWASAYERNAATWSHVEYVNAALAALDAHTEVHEVATLAAVKEAFEGAKAQNETLRGVLSSQTPATVTLALWWNDEQGAHALYQPGSQGDEPWPGWTRLGTVTLPLDREGGR